MCDCLEQIQAIARVQHNTLIVHTISFGGDLPNRILLATEKWDPKKRGKPIQIAATYCPICGKKYVMPKKKEVKKGGE